MFNALSVSFDLFIFESFTALAGEECEWEGGGLQKKKRKRILCQNVLQKLMCMCV